MVSKRMLVPRTNAGRVETSSNYRDRQKSKSDDNFRW
jgi:hypothetical protein